MRTRMRVGAALLALTALIAGCGDDDDDTDAASASAVESDAEGESASDSEEVAEDFCGGYIELTAGGDPSPERIREVAELAPGDGAAALEAIAAGFEEQGEAFFESTEFGENYRAIGGIAIDECADTTLDVTASEYAFEGIPATLEAGFVGANFTNDGAEFHELVVFGKAEGVTESFDELLALGEEGAEGKIEEKGGTFAEPGASAPALFDLDPGEYLAVCFVPVGSVPDAETEAEGPPHLEHGMRVEFTVS